MHGRPRQPKDAPIDPEKAAAKRKKFQQFRLLTNAVLDDVRSEKSDESSLAQSAQLLKHNPDIYTVWNYRRRALGPVLEGLEGSERARDAAATELKVTEAALLENPKSYPAWHHRLWIHQKGLTSLTEELKLVTKFLALDSRNFLAWQYRRRIVRLSGTPAEDELSYSQTLIDANFSNYSAWHSRSCLLTELAREQQVVDLQDLLSPATTGGEGDSPAAIAPNALDKEFELVEQAFFTDPEDQSAYVYHRWLLGVVMASLRRADAGSRTQTEQEVEAVLQREESRCRELLEVEPDRSRCKWPLLSLAHILRLQREVGAGSAAGQERSEILDELMRIDPLRRGFYADAKAL